MHHCFERYHSCQNKLYGKVQKDDKTALIISSLQKWHKDPIPGISFCDWGGGARVIWYRCGTYIWNFCRKWVTLTCFLNTITEGHWHIPVRQGKTEFDDTPVKIISFKIKITRFKIFAPNFFTSCVILGKSPDLSELPHLTCEYTSS